MKKQRIIIFIFALVFISASKKRKFRLDFTVNNYSIEKNTQLRDRIRIYYKDKFKSIVCKKYYDLSKIDSVVFVTERANLSIQKSDLNKFISTISVTSTIQLEFFDSLQKCNFCDTTMKRNYHVLVYISSDDFGGFFIGQ